MGYFKVGKGKEMHEQSKEKVEDILKYLFKANTERGISDATCKRYGIRAGLSETDGTTIEAYYFPSFSQKGKIVGFMKQDKHRDYIQSKILMKFTTYTNLQKLVQMN